MTYRSNLPMSSPRISFPSLCSLLAATSLGLLFTGCGKKEEAAPPPAVRPVKFLVLDGSDMQRKIELPGQIQAMREASMGFEVPGLLQEVLVNEGDPVKKGQVLARLDRRDYQAAKDSAEAQLRAARSEAERAQALFDRQATSKQRLDVAMAQLQVAESAYDRAAKALEDTELRSPMDGEVARVVVDDFVSVQAKEQIMIVHDISRLKVVIDVPETLAVLVDPTIPMELRNVRTTAEVFLTTGYDQGFPAEILETATTANPTTRTFAVTMAFDPPKNMNVLPGMTARLRADATRLVMPSRSRFEVPSHAVGGQADGKPFVWKIDPDAKTVSKVHVELGRLSGDQIEISANDLEVGDVVATSGILQLREGMPVREFKP